MLVLVAFGWGSRSTCWVAANAWLRPLLFGWSRAWPLSDPYSCHSWQLAILDKAEHQQQTCSHHWPVWVCSSALRFPGRERNLVGCNGTTPPAAKTSTWEWASNLVLKHHQGTVSGLYAWLGPLPRYATLDEPPGFQWPCSRKCFQRRPGHVTPLRWIQAKRKRPLL